MQTMLNTLKSARSNSRCCCVSIVNAGLSLLLGVCYFDWDSGVMETWCPPVVRHVFGHKPYSLKNGAMHNFCIWCKPTREKTDKHYFTIFLPQSCSARDQLALTLGALNSDAPRRSRDSLHCSSGYSTQTTTPSCSEDTIHTHSK